MNKNLTTLLKFTLVSIFFFCAYSTGIAPVSSQETKYELLEPIPYVETEEGKTTASQYLSGIFSFVIGIAGVLAVLMIIYGGIKYMSTDAFTGKDEAKGIIGGAIWGLVLTIGSWLILNTINPDLVNFNLSIDRQLIRGELNPPEWNLINLSPEEQIRLGIADDEITGCTQCTRVVVGPRPATGVVYPTDKGVPFPSKPPSSNGCKGTTFCYVHKDLFPKLVALANELHSMDVTDPAIIWQVTEMIPPT